MQSILECLESYDEFNIVIFKERMFKEEPIEVPTRKF